MNIQNYVKHFTKWKVKTSVNSTDTFGGVEVTATEKDIEGYLSKSMSSSGQSGEAIPTTRSGGILFTKPEVDLNTGDILNSQYQVIDFDKFPSHNEYRLNYIDKWNKGA